MVTRSCLGSDFEEFKLQRRHSDFDHAQLVTSSQAWSHGFSITSYGRGLFDLTRSPPFRDLVTCSSDTCSTAREEEMGRKRLAKSLWSGVVKSRLLAALHRPGKAYFGILCCCRGEMELSRLHVSDRSGTQ
ncbi:unnamed protein product [Sphagnum jensenii]|uniref:Uncharacterized protein n=1 Tax=Sphagnum jensenii TaxID=128206 RepID=A0ABP0VRG1_9BRYO